MIKERKKLKNSEVWNVDALYSSWDSWYQDFSKAKEKEDSPKWPKLSIYKGKISSSAQSLANLFSQYFTTKRYIEKLMTYAHLRMDEDLGNDEAKVAYGKVIALYNDFLHETSWIQPEILDLSQEIFEKYCADQSLHPYKFYLEKIYRLKQHTLSSSEENLLALSNKVLDNNQQTFSALANTDMQFEKIADSLGNVHELTNGLYGKYLLEEDRVLRKAAFTTLHKTYEKYENTFAQLLQGQMQNHLYIADARKYESPLHAALYVHNINPEVYYNLLSVTKENLPLLHRYVNLRKKMLGVDTLHPYDMYVPLVKEWPLEKNYTEACELVVDSVALLGNDYQNILRKGLFQERWVDPFENARKRSGAYSSGCYDSMPYILMNFHGSLNDILTLTHEAGHSMHSYFSRKTQSYHQSSYPIFVAEVASTFNERLLLDYLLENASKKEEKVFLLSYMIEQIRKTFFRQVLFAQFELQMSTWTKEQIPLTASLLKENYYNLNKEHFGHDLTLDKEIEMEWARVPHFYYNFYVYQYATGISAAYALYDRITESPKEVKKYMEFLQAGGKNYPIELLKIAGVDMSKTGAIEAIMLEFKKLLDLLEEILVEKTPQEGACIRK